MGPSSGSPSGAGKEPEMPETSIRERTDNGTLPSPEVTVETKIAEPARAAQPDEVERAAKTVTARNVDLYYGDFHAVQDVSMTIEPNKVTALIGSSGCGKTTFLRSLNRMHELTPGARVEGEITIDGQNIYADGVDPVQVRRVVGMVFQAPNPFPTMSIYEN